MGAGVLAVNQKRYKMQWLPAIYNSTGTMSSCTMWQYPQTIQKDMKQPVQPKKDCAK